MMDLEKQYLDLDFDVCKSIRYHSYRRGFFEKASKLLEIVSLLSVTAATYFLLGHIYYYYAELSCLACFSARIFESFVGYHDLILHHNNLYRQFSVLSQDIGRNVASKEKNISRWNEQRKQLNAEERDIKDWLVRRCCAEECVSRGCELRDEWKLRWWQIALSQLVSFRGHF